MKKKMPTIGKIIAAVNAPKLSKAAPAVEIKNVKKIGKSPAKPKAVSQFAKPRKSARHTVDGEQF